MAGPTGGAGLLESGAKGRLIAGICRGLQGAKLGHHIAIGRFKAGTIGPDGRKGASIARAAPCRETRGEAIEKTNHLADCRSSCARITALIHHGLDAFHLPRDPLQAILPRGNDIALGQGRARQGQERSKNYGAFPKFHVILPVVFEGSVSKDPISCSGNGEPQEVHPLAAFSPARYSRAGVTVGLGV
jgi:hypothetical protein